MAEVSGQSLKRLHTSDDQRLEGSDTKRIKTPNGSPAASIARPDAATLIADARARAEAIKARLQGSKTVLNGQPPAAQTPSVADSSSVSKAPMSRVEEMRARVAALTAGKSAPQSQQRTAFPVPAYQNPIYEDGTSRARGGLSAALHPALLESNASIPSKNTKATAKQSQPSKSGKAVKKQLDLSGPSQDKIRANPYVDTSIATGVRSRNPKQLKFLEKGKYIAQAAALRRQHQLEEMKKRIALQSRKVGISEDPSEKNFAVEAPPEIEWWDEGLVKDPTKAYTSDLKIDVEDSVITRLEVHPISIAKPEAKVIIKPMYLTPKEQAKMRRQRRMADLKEHQMKVRLGMEAPDPPKVKRGNMMRILGEEAVKDPTAVEARVNKEIAEREQKHKDANEDRKLSKDEKHEKLDAKKAADKAKGVILTVYKIDSLANGRHFFKVQKNLEQIGGLGYILSSPKFSLVLCEAGQRGTQIYKKLLLNRIDWTENSPSQIREGNKRPQAAWLQAEDEAGNLKDLSTNKAQLIFEGEEKGTMFRKTTVRSVETDKEAMDALERTKMASFWTLAKSLD